MNAIVPASFGKIASRFANVPVENDLAAGIEASYGIMKYKGKVWTAVYKGAENKLMRPDGDGPRNSIDVVILKAPKVKSKIFYAQGFVEGSTEAPDCWSTNGVTPDPQVAKKQHATCMGCPMNEWGSRVTESGKKGKRCSDSKRIAIVPANPGAEDPSVLANELLGGPMLLRVPAASLSALASYGDMMAKANMPYAAIVTRISFDPESAYPQFVFTPVRPLTEAEADVAVELAGSAQVDRILAEEGNTAPADTAPAAIAFVAPLPTQEVKAPAPVAPPAAPPPPPPAPAPAPVAPVTPVVAPAALTAVTGFGPVVAVAPEPPAVEAAPAAAPGPAEATQDAFVASLDDLLKA